MLNMQEDMKSSLLISNLITSLLIYVSGAFKTSCDSIGCARYCSSPVCTPNLKATAQRDYDCFFDGEILPLARQLKVFQTRRLSTPALTWNMSFNRG